MITIRFALALALLSGALSANQDENFDYFSANRVMIQNGVQAVLMCNGLFTSNRTLEQIFTQELAYLKSPVGTAAGGDYVVDQARRAVAVGSTSAGSVVRAAFRDGIGCVVLGPDQSFDDIEMLPSLEVHEHYNAVVNAPWPMGDTLTTAPLADYIDPVALQAASDWTFDRDTPEQDTLSLLVVHKGEIVHERYADGIDMLTRTRTWSTAKSIAATLIGMRVDAGRMALDKPLDIDWLPKLQAEAPDPRDSISLRHVLNMSSGLFPSDSFGMEYATGSGLAYWAGASSITGARKRGLIRTPGTFWDYENYDTLLAVYAMKRTFDTHEQYATYPAKALLNRLGMYNTLLSTDRFGDFILSSQVYTNARDLARFGLLYLQRGVWMGERIISESWIEFVRTPAPASAPHNDFYGGQFWLVPSDRQDVPSDAYATAGNRGQYVVIVPSHDLVIVRRGLDYRDQGFNRWDMTREVLRAFKQD